MTRTYKVHSFPLSSLVWRMSEQSGTLNFMVSGVFSPEKTKRDWIWGLSVLHKQIIANNFNNHTWHGEKEGGGLSGQAVDPSGFNIAQKSQDDLISEPFRSLPQNSIQPHEYFAGRIREFGTAKGGAAPPEAQQFTGFDTLQDFSMYIVPQSPSLEPVTDSCMNKWINSSNEDNIISFLSDFDKGRRQRNAYAHAFHQQIFPTDSR